MANDHSPTVCFDHSNVFLDAAPSFVVRLIVSDLPGLGCSNQYLPITLGQNDTLGAREV